ncbi:hypothetical protein AB0K60_09540 [Thermopolyspora sp. NPDC052614]|uniref:hypothetical protein n=1 Tax=Thermopolyspora sp. NPDC052614 TaxID=3155682 RepID=UPI0034222EF5
MPAYAFRVSGPLIVALVACAISPAPSPAASSAAGCRIASYYKIDSFRRRDFYIPGTRYIDGPGGQMRVWVMRSYTVKSEFEIEDWREKERRRFFHARGGPRDITAETRREVETELVRERAEERSAKAGREVTRERPGDGEAGGDVSEELKASRDKERKGSEAGRIKIKESHVRLTKEEERELLRAMRLMISPLISDDHTVEAGHEYVRKISRGKYGYLRYRVFGYRVGFSKWWRGDDCRVHRAASGVAGVPARVEGWVYRESKRPNPKWLGAR